MTAITSPPVSVRTLNRALLARQLLLERQNLRASTAIERLVGLQAQSPPDPYLALWSRLQDFDPESLSRLLATRKAVRLAMMRSTIHLMTARDAIALRPVVQRAVERSFTGSFSKRLGRANAQDVADAGRTLLDEAPRTFAELGAALSPRWTDAEPLALANAVRALVPLVQIPPRGLWRTSGQAVHATAESWLATPSPSRRQQTTAGTRGVTREAADTNPDRMILRYLAAFGPASIADAQAWSGLSRLRESFERLAPTLRTCRDGKGRTLYDVRSGPLPDPDTPAPPRFLPEYDNLFLAHADRSRIGSGEHQAQLLQTGGTIRTFMIDGFIAGTWAMALAKGDAVLTLRPFNPLPQGERRELGEEGERLLAFLAPEARQRDVRVQK